MEYKYRLENNREISLYIENEVIEIEEIFDDKIYKSYRLIYSDDYGFSAYIEDDETTELNFIFDRTHPLYYPFSHFLNKDDEIKIASDFRKEKYDSISYVKITRRNEIIILGFVNHIPHEHSSVERFDFGVKNIMFDLRSKLDHKKTDIKHRLFCFFDEATETLKNENCIIKSYDDVENKVKCLLK